MTPTTTIGTPDAVFLYSGPDELYREHRPVLDALGGGHTHLGEDIGRAAAYDIALLDIFWTAMAATPTRWPWPVPRASAHASWRRSPRASAPSCRRSSSRPRRTWPGGGFSGEGNPITSAASSMAHIIETSEAHGIDARMMRAADEMARRVIERGHGTSGFIRIVESMEARG